ncbi:MAG TPA: hypothetical protein VF765_35125, partial [Polyangiaceae bacterium]
SVAGFALGALWAIANAHAIATRNRPLSLRPRSTGARQRQQPHRPQQKQQQQQAEPPRPDVVQGAAPPGVR